jgi:uncharacterized protein YdeI (YjbR/CyaY-like superfamily)
VNKTSDLPILPFESAKKFETWLAKNHPRSQGLWLQIFKKDSGHKTVTRAEALDVALCYGWIDGQGKPNGEASYLQKFTPRRARSVWSKRNQEHVARLIKARRMKPAGLKAVDAAKKDGRWERAYDSPKNMTVPKDFLSALAKNKKAKEFFATLNKANLYAIAWRLHNAKKPETRERRKQTFLAMLAKGEKLHP